MGRNRRISRIGERAFCRAGDHPAIRRQLEMPNSLNAMNFELPIQIRELRTAPLAGGICLACFKSNIGRNSLAVIIPAGNIGYLCGSCRFAGTAVSKRELCLKVCAARDLVQTFDRQLGFTLTEFYWQIISKALDLAETAEHLPGATAREN